MRRKITDRMVNPRGLAQELLATEPLTNKTIWMYWDKGWEAAPALCKLSFDSWRIRNPDWDVCFLDREKALALTAIPDDIVALDLLPAHLADMIRLELLAQYGGVWADMTTFCERPLDDWLLPAMPYGFFAFCVTEQDTCSNWFLASAAGNPILVAWRDTAYAYWSCADRPTTYLMFYDLFGLAMRRNRQAGRMWRFTTKHERMQENTLRYLGFDRKIFDDFVAFVDRGVVPLHKFSFNEEIPEDFSGTPFAWVTGVDTRADMAAKAANICLPISASLPDEDR
jgi:hypothetical protein